MFKVRSFRLSSKLLNLIGLAILVFSTFLTGSVGVAYAQDDNSAYYYYANGNRIELTRSLNWVSVKFVSDESAVQFMALKNSGAMLGALDQARQIPHPKLTLLPLKVSLTKQTINSLRADTANFLQVNPVFQTVDAEMAVTDEFIVTFPAGISMDEIDAINSSHGVEMVEPILGQENTFVLRVANTRLDVLSMANLYQESGAAIHSAPNFVRIIKTNPSDSQTRQSVGPMAATNDTLYTDQWYLNNTQQYGSGMTLDADIDAPEAWDHTTGSATIIIAVIDEGVDLTHVDYISKLVAGYDATGLGSGGGPSGDDAHGTNVAGLAAASGNNSLGVAGVCQNCRIMPVRIAYSDAFGDWVTTDAILANGITWAYQNGADILNNSWGGGLEATVINTAVSNAKIFGRGGKGAVVVFAAGNDNLSSVGYPAYLTDVIAVGASNMCDQRKSPIYDLCNGYEDYWGSSYGSALDISAPGVWLDSTDIMGAAGYSSGNYYYEMNGTSGASPIVSGVAGLMLSVNPNLTATQVQSILQSTADDVNGGGFDVVMGYGRVNANRAVQASMFTFSDVLTDYWAWNYVERLYNAGITGGCSVIPLNYCPDSTVTRAQMAVFLLKGMHGSSYAPPAVGVSTGFNDVAMDYWAAASIKQLAAEGITGGCGAGNYCPDATVTRAQMAVFLLKAEHGSSYSPSAATGVFTDAPMGYWADKWIEQLAVEGITGGCGAGIYCPDSSVTRAQMAVFLVKTFNLP